MSIMPLNRLSNNELILHVDNMPNPSTLEKLLADRLCEVIRERDAAQSEIDEIQHPFPL
jgi:hypothetical protein